MSVEDCLAHKWLEEDAPERPLALEAPSPAVSVVESEGEEKDPASSTSDSMDEEEEEELSAGLVAPLEEIKSAQDDLEEDHSSLQSFCDDQSEDGGASTSDKENSLVFNCNNSGSNNISISSCSSSSSHSSTEVLFPDAPTTPKVLRKAPSETPPSVKALVKKFQVDAVKQQMSIATTAEMSPASPVTANPHNHPHHQSACFVSQIPKLVNSPKSSYVTGSSRYSSSSPRTGSPRVVQVGSKGLSLDSMICDRKSPSGGSSPTVKSTTGESPLKSSSPSARYSQTRMSCVLCGEFGCRHQTTTTGAVATTVARKPILGMEQRITC